MPDLTADLQYRDVDDLLSTIVDEHRRAELLYAAFKESRDPDDRLILVYNLIKALSQHAGCEELVVYPLFKQRIGGEEGKRIFERSVEEHRQLKVDLSRVDGMTWKDAGFEEAVHKAMQDQLAHAKEEEKEVAHQRCTAQPMGDLRHRSSVATHRR